MNILGITSTIYGIKETAIGALRIAQDKLVSGTKHLFLGAANLSAGVALLGYDLTTQTNLLRTVMVGSCLWATAIGGYQLISTTNLHLRCSQVLIGAWLGGLIYGLKNHILRTAQPLMPLAFASSSLLSGGIQDLNRQEYSNGVLKIATGAAGILLSGYYLYNQPHTQEPMPPALASRLQSYSQQLEPMRIREDSESCKEQIEDLTIIGIGISKCAYSSPEFDYVMKLPNTELPKNLYFNSLEREYQNYLSAIEVIVEQNLTQIAVPRTFYTKLGMLPVLFSEKFNLVNFRIAQTWDKAKKALEQLTKFTDFFGDCDLDIRLNHNTGFLEGTQDDPIIGIFDLDCGPS